MGRTSYGCQVGTGCSGGPEIIPVGKMKAFFTMEVAWNKDFQDPFLWDPRGDEQRWSCLGWGVCLCTGHSLEGRRQVG